MSEPMSPRARLQSLWHGQKPDRVPWFGDLDYWATALIGRMLRPTNFKETDAYIQWHQDLGVGFYLQGYFPFKTIFENCRVKIWHEGKRKYTEIATPNGTLRDCWLWLEDSFCEAPVEHFVKSEADLPVLRYIYENIRYEPDYSFGWRRLEQIADMGILLCYLPKSPFMQLVAQDAGIEAVTMMTVNAPDEFTATLQVMEKAVDQAAALALASPAEALMIPENLSSEVVGPRFFERYMRTFHEKWNHRIAAAGKHSFIHMDGTLRGLIRQVAGTGFNVLEALTPAPVGDLAIEEFARSVDQPDTIFWGGLPGAYFTALISDAEFDRFVRHVLAVMRQQPRYVLGVADQVPPDGLEYRVRRVAELVEQYGSYV